MPNLFSHMIKAVPHGRRGRALLCEDAPLICFAFVPIPPGTPVPNGCQVVLSATREGRRTILSAPIKRQSQLLPSMCATPETPSPMVRGGRTVPQWSCMKGCGACCFLGDFDLDVLTDLLKNPDDVEAYLSMLAPDGWCKYYSKQDRACTTYAERPRFCRVDFDVFSSLYDVKTEAEFNSFAIECCNEHIGNIYPALDNQGQSEEQRRFSQIIWSAP